MVMQAWKLCFLNCFDLGLFGDLKAEGWVSSGGAILLWLMKKTSKWRNKRKEVKLDKRLGPKSEKCFLYFSLLYSKQVFDFFNLTLANFKQNEFSSSLVPFCLASLSFHTCWSLAEKNRPSHFAPPWIPALPAWVTAAVWPFGRLMIVHLSKTAQWGTIQVRQSTDAIHLFYRWLLVETDFLPLSSEVSFLDLFFCSEDSELFFAGGVLQCWSWSEWLLRLFDISELLWQSVGVHLMSVCFLQGSVYELLSYVLTTFALLFSRIHLLANASPVITEIMSTVLPREVKN